MTTPGPDLFRLDGRVAIVTGAGGALGRATAVGLARAGAALAINDLDPSRLAATAAEVRATGMSCVEIAGDAAASMTVTAVLERVDREFGRLDVLVNNAGINPRQDRPEDLPIDVWNEVLRVNLTGYLSFAQGAARHMIANGRGGSIVNISSIAAASALGRGNLAFGVSKAGVDQLTRELAVAWACHGIRVNSILPCQFLNDGLRALVADPAKSEIAARMVSGIPLGRMGEAGEIVGPVLFLASDASSMVTGVNLPVDGGNLAFNAGGSLPRE